MSEGSRGLKALLALALLALGVPLLTHSAQPAAAAPNQISTIAGTGTAGYSGDCEPVKFDGPRGVASDGSGNLYVADYQNHRVRKVTPGGGVITIAGTGVNGFGGDGGPATSAMLWQPTDVAVDVAGNVYVADSFNNRVRRISTDGVITTVAGSNGHDYEGDGGPATDAELWNPLSVELDASGNLYIADFAHHVVRKVDTGGTITTFAGTGVDGDSGDGGQATAAELRGPSSVAFDSLGRVYIADANAFRIRRVDTGGVINTVVDTGVIGYSGDGGPADQAQIRSTFGLSFDAAGNLLFADSNSHRIRKVTPAGTITTVAGNGSSGNGADGLPATMTMLDSPQGVAISPTTGDVYVSDLANHRIRRIDANGDLQHVAGDPGGTAGFGDCTPGVEAQLDTPFAVEVDNTLNRNVYIADYFNHVVRKYDPVTQALTTVAGTGVAGHSGDGGPATAAQLDGPAGLLFDSPYLYIVDSNNHVVRRLQTLTGEIDTFAGTGVAGYSGDGGPAAAAQFDTPFQINRNALDVLYVTDFGNSVVRQIATDGTITTLAGTGVAGYSGDGGPATAAQLDEPSGVASTILYPPGGGAPDRVVLITDQGNDRIRLVHEDGTIETVAGTGADGDAGDYGPAVQAELDDPVGIDVALDGSIVFGDAGNHRLRRIDTDGTISPYAGTGEPGNSGDGGLATHAQLYRPGGLSFDLDDNLYVADTFNHQVRRIEAGNPVGYLRVTTSPALPTEIIVDGVSRDSWGLNWVEYPVGTYEVCFGAISGYETPSCQNVTIEPGETTEVVGTYAARGYLRVVTDPAVPSTIRVNGVPRNDWGVWIDVPPGTYEVCYGLTEGFDPPPCEDVEVVAGATATATGVFTPDPAALGPAAAHGYLRVTTDPAVASRIRVDGALRDAWGLNWLKMAPGDHSVCFGEVVHHQTPDCQEVTVVDGATTVVQGGFAPKGFLRVLTDPAVPVLISVDGLPANMWGVWNALPPGGHQVCFGPIDGLEAPDCENAVLTSGATTTVTGVYTSP